MEAKKPSFLNHDHALLTSMVQLKDPESCITLIRNSAASGAEAYGIQMCEIERQYRNEADLRKIFSRCGKKPIYITNYRLRESLGMQDDELAEELLLGVRAGASLVDVPTDMYDPAPLQMSFKPEAVEKQKALIDRIHEAGGEVMMSMHTTNTLAAAGSFTFMPPEKVVEIGLLQEERGADIAKIVTRADTEEELLDNFKAMTMLKKELNIPFLFLSNGRHNKLQRIIGPYFGNCMILCMYQYDNHTSREQPLLRSAKQVMDNIDWDPYRE